MGEYDVTIVNGQRKILKCIYNITTRKTAENTPSINGSL